MRVHHQQDIRVLEKEDFKVAITNMFQQGGGIWRITKHVPWFGPVVRSIPRNLLSKIADSGTRAFFRFLEASHASCTTVTVR
jgi:hypothetical protein